MLRNDFFTKPTKFGNNQENNDKVEKANSFPIENMYSGILKKSGKTLMGNCPFHQESVPSFAIYPETNTWCCFAGCGGGDAISFYMKLNNCDFKEALEALAL